MNQILESIRRYWLDWKNLSIAKSSILMEDIQEYFTDFPDNFKYKVKEFAREEYESIKSWVVGLDWAARGFEVAYIFLAIALTIILLSNYFLGQNPNFLGLTTEGVLWFYLFIVLFTGLLTLPFAKVKTVFPLILGYLVYLPVIALIEWSRNLNNPDFRVVQLFEINSITQVHFYSLLIILTISFALHLVQREFYVFKRFEDTGLYRTRRSVWTMAFMAPLLVLNPLFIQYLEGKLGDLNNLTLSTYWNVAIFPILFWFFVGYILFASLFNSLREIGVHRFGIWNIIFSSLFLSILTNLLIQSSIVFGNTYQGKSIYPGAIIYQILVIFCTCLISYLIINRYLYTTLFLSLTAFVIPFVNYLKFQYRQEPLLPSDFIWIKQPELFASFVDLNYVLDVFILLVIIIYLIWNIQILSPSKQITQNYFVRITLLVTTLFFVNIGVTTFKSEKDGKVSEGVPIISVLNNGENTTWRGLSFNASYKSLAYVWSKQLTQVLIETPEDYSKEKMDEIYEKYNNIASELNKGRERSLKNQTVIYVLSESFTDPSRISSNQISRNPIPEIQKIKSENSGGLMHSDGFGGGTANMEFQTLTGLPFYNYSSTTSNLYVEVVPNMQYLPSITRAFAGEDSYIIHPFEANSYNRLNIYRNLGFEHLHFLTDSEDKIENVQYQGAHVSDATVYQNILDKIDTKENQFFSVVTMQNHIPWFGGDPADLTASNSHLDEEQNKSLTNYVRLLTHTDSATKDFLEKLKKIDKEITVVFYGDHLPGLYSQSTFDENPSLQYLTDYFIWSNFENKKVDYPILNSSDFSAAMLDKTNTKVSPYFAMLGEVLKNRKLGEANGFSRESEFDKDLALIQYDITNGQGYILEKANFFEIP